MKKTLLSFFMFVAFIATAWAGDVTFDFTNPTALNPSITPSETASSGAVIDVNTPFTNGEVTISFVNIDGAKESQMAKIWTQSESKNLAKELRAYKGGSITIAAATNITSIIFDGAKKTTMTATVGTFDNGSWSGSSQSVTFDLSGTININTITVTYSDDSEGDDVVDPTPTPDPDPTPEPEPEVERATIFTAPFSANQGEFIFDDVVLPEGSTYVWKHDSSRGYMKASSYVGGASKASESWLVSPVIDLTDATDCILSFEQCANYFNSVENLVAACSVKVKAEGDADWTTLTLDATATGTDWNWVNSTASLADYSDKKIQIAFVYTSTAEVAGTWEVKNVVVKGVGGIVVDLPEYTSIMDLKDNSTDESVAINFTFTNLLVTGVSGKNVHATDGNEGILFYGTTTLEAGDMISGTLKGELQLYNGLTRVADADYTNVSVTSKNNEVTPVVLTIDQIVENSGYLVYENMLVNLDSLYFTADALTSRAVVLKDKHENELKLYDNYNKLTDVSFDTTKPYNVTGVVAQYKGAPQIYVLSADDVKILTSLVDAETIWEKDEVVILKGEEWIVNNVVSTISDGTVSYTSSDNAVATVDTDGSVTINGYGYAEIKVTTTETENFLPSEATFKLYVIEGEGTLANPYTIADAQYFIGKVSDKVWVKGTIIGFYNNNAFHAGVESAPASNLAIGTEALSMPIQLSSGTDVRTALNLLDNPDKLNTEIWLYGKIEKYFSVPGLKSVSDCSFDGETTLGIEQIKADAFKDTIIYSVSGQRLNQPVKGINIINGKKVIVK